jgi:plastocyanin
MNAPRALRTTLLAALAVAALPFVSCGGGGGGGVTNPPPPSGGGGGGTGGGTADVTITIIAENGNMSFSPDPATVNVGQRVAWRNGAAAIHTATQNGGGFDTGSVDSGGLSQAITMSAAGTFGYHCSLHPAMVGTLIVR